MNIIINIALLILGFVLLIKGADFFVDGASSTALNFKISKILIGLTIVAFGTSAPELAVSLQALADGAGDMVLGNVIGSNVMNILLIIGIAAVIKPIQIKNTTVRAELPITLLISSVFAVLALDTFLGDGNVNLITRADALVILLVFGVFINYLVRQALKSRELIHENPPFKLFKSLLLVILGLAGIVIGSDLVVSSASKIATSIGITQRVIALTIVAFGTSLPELVTTIVSSKKGEQDLLMGNIIGSNIFNICVVLSIPVLIFGTIAPTINIIDIILLLLSAGLLFVFSINNRTITRGNGLAMLGVFLLYYFLVMVV